MQDNLQRGSPKENILIRHFSTIYQRLIQGYYNMVSHLIKAFLDCQICLFEWKS